MVGGVDEQGVGAVAVDRVEQAADLVVGVAVAVVVLVVVGGVLVGRGAGGRQPGGVVLLQARLVVGAGRERSGAGQALLLVAALERGRADVGAVRLVQLHGQEQRCGGVAAAQYADGAVHHAVREAEALVLQPAQPAAEAVGAGAAHLVVEPAQVVPGVVREAAVGAPGARIAGRVQVPLADVVRRVAGLREQLAEHRHRARECGVVAHGAVAVRRQAGVPRRARQRAQRRGGDAGVEQGAACRQPVDVRRRRKLHPGSAAAIRPRRTMPVRRPVRRHHVAPLRIGGDEHNRPRTAHGRQYTNRGLATRGGWINLVNWRSVLVQECSSTGRRYCRGQESASCLPAVSTAASRSLPAASRASTRCAVK